MPSDAEPEPEAPVTAGLNSINILPFQYFLREGFYNDKDAEWPAGLKGTHFEDPCLVEKAQRELIIPPFDAGESIQDAVRELRESIKLLLDHDHDFSATFVPKGDKDLPQTGGDMGPRVVGLYAERVPGKREDVFVPLSAIIKNPTVYCDRKRFPRFFDHSPNLPELKTQVKKVVSRSVEKEADFAEGFKKFIGALRALYFKLGMGLLLLHLTLTLLYGIVPASALVTPLAVYARSHWASKKKLLKNKFTKEFPTYREYWRWKKDEETARQFSYNFPSLTGARYLGQFFDIGADKWRNSLPPDTTHNDKGMAGSKKGDTRLQFATCCVLAFYVFHYTPFFGLAFERCTALFFFVTPVALERTAAVLASTSDAAINFSARYGLPHYRDELMQGFAALPAAGRHAARIAIRKVLYGSVWQKNKASLTLPEVGDPLYPEVMPEIYDICKEEYGFEHTDERVCKAMFRRTEDKHVDNVEHFVFLMVILIAPLMFFTPKAHRGSSFFIGLPVAFFACFLLVRPPNTAFRLPSAFSSEQSLVLAQIPHEVRNSLVYFGDFEAARNSSDSW